jgi:hypothetical protein
MFHPILGVTPNSFYKKELATIILSIKSSKDGQASSGELHPPFTISN